MFIQIDMIKLSIIISTYLRPELLFWCLCSIKKQEFNEDFEIVVLNDGVKDDTETICNKFKDLLNIKYLFTGNRNTNNVKWHEPDFDFGIKHASSTNVILCSSDIFLIETSILSNYYRIIVNGQSCSLRIKDDINSGYLEYVRNSKGGINSVDEYWTKISDKHLLDSTKYFFYGMNTLSSVNKFRVLDLHAVHLFHGGCNASGFRKKDIVYSKEGFTVLTPTSDRPKCFDICCKMVDKQTVKPVQWLIVDDSLEQPVYPPSWDFVDYHYRNRSNNEPIHTLSCQVAYALEFITTDKVIIMEDDDWYYSRYLEMMLRLFENSKADLVGQGQAIYYVPRYKKYYLHPNKNHASFAQTGFTRNLFGKLKCICNNSKEPFIDLQLWKQPVSKFISLNETPYCVGMKGMPGKLGGGSGHDHKLPNFRNDSDLKIFNKYVIEDKDIYEKFLGISL